MRNLPANLWPDVAKHITAAPELGNDVWVLSGQHADPEAGSMKYVSALGALEALLRNGIGIQGKTMLDASSGNYALALAVLGKRLGLPVELYVSSKATEATLAEIRALGAMVTVVDGPTWAAYKAAKALADQFPDRYVFTDQLNNAGNAEGHYRITGPAILRAIPNAANVIMAMGSGGGINGTARYLAEQRPGVHIFATVNDDTEDVGIVGTFWKQKDYLTPFIAGVRRLHITGHGIDTDLFTPEWAATTSWICP